MQVLKLRKPDGRKLLLYSRDTVGAIDPTIVAPQPEGELAPPRPQLRWHPLRGEWVAYAAHRQNRTFMPPKEYNPLAATRPGHAPTELPAGRYDMAVFENRFPSLALGAVDPTEDFGVPARAGVGVCEVVVFTQDPESSLTHLGLDEIELLLEVWGDRTAELGANDEISYVMPFENRGTEVGVTLHHPHGQIYAYPFIPPVAERELAQAGESFAATGRTVLETMAEHEIKDGHRLLYVGAEAVAFVPACARYPYETWVTTRQPTARLDLLDAAQRRDLARALKTVLLKYEGLWKRPFPYLMVVHQAPTDGRVWPGAHLHIEFSPPYRSRERLKFLAGTELGAGMFANDALPEEKAAELQAVPVQLDSRTEPEVIHATDHTNADRT